MDFVSLWVACDDLKPPVKKYIYNKEYDTNEYPEISL